MRLAHEVTGPADAPAVVLSNSLGTTWEMWDSLAARLASDWRVVRCDTRGHGRSPVPDGPYDVASLADDVLELASSLGLDRFAFVGLSLGGAIGQHLALGDRLTSAVLCCTVPRFGDPAMWHERAASVRAGGMGVLDEGTRARWFTSAFRAAQPTEVDRLVGMLTSTPVAGYAACCEALAEFDSWSSLPRIDVPVRVVAGAEDPVAPPATCEEMVAALPRADLVVVPDASHLANIEQPEAFEAAVIEHLEAHR